MKYSLIPKSDFAKNVLTLMTGTTIAQAIPVLLSPVLTRVYTDEDMGLFSVFSSLVLGLSTIAALRYDFTIVSSKKDEESKSLVCLSRRISFAMMIVITLLIAFFINPLTEITKTSSIKQWFYLIGLVVFVYIQIGIVQMYLNRKKQYKDISKSRILQGGGVIVSQIIIGFFLNGVLGLIIGFLLGQVLSFLYLFKTTRQEIKCTNIQPISLMKKHKKMPLLNGPTALFDTIRLNGISIVLIHLFSSAVLGQYALAWRILQAPLGLINGAFSQVSFQQLSSMEHHLHYAFLKKSIKRSFLIGFVPFSILFFFAPELFAFVFGEDWVLAGQIGSILTPWLYLNLITSPISSYFIVVNRQGALLWFSFFYMLVPFIAIWYLKSDFLLAMKGLSYAMSGMLLIFLAIVLYFSKQDEKATVINK